MCTCYEDEGCRATGRVDVLLMLFLTPVLSWLILTFSSSPPAQTTTNWYRYKYCKRHECSFALLSVLQSVFSNHHFKPSFQTKRKMVFRCFGRLLYALRDDNDDTSTPNTEFYSSAGDSSLEETTHVVHPASASSHLQVKVHDLGVFS